MSRPLFVGFLAKRVIPVPEPLSVLGVERVASVSQCIVPGPPDWVDAWAHNEYGFYDTEEIARSVVPKEGTYELFAYELYPLKVDSGGRRPLAVVEGIDGRIPPHYAPLGVDVVSRSSSDFFECSPLSCNLAARDFQVTGDCLAADEATALRYAHIFAAGGYEPGPYYLIRVWGTPGR